MLFATLNEKRDRLDVMPEIAADDVVHITDERVNSDVSSKSARRHIFRRVQVPMPIFQYVRLEQITGHGCNMHNVEVRGLPGLLRRPSRTQGEGRGGSESLTWAVAFSHCSTDC